MKIPFRPRLDFEPRPFNAARRMRLMAADASAEELLRYGLMSALGALFMVALLLPSVPLGRITLWVAGLALVWAAILGVAAAWQTGVRDIRTEQELAGAIRGVGIAHGAMWGAVMALPEPGVAQAVACMVLTGVSAGGAFRIATTQGAATAQIVATWLAVVLSLVGTHNPNAEVITLVGLGVAGFCALTASRITQVAHAGIRVRVSNEELLRELLGEQRHVADAWERMKEQQGSIEALGRRLQTAATRDDLTGVHNRRRFGEALVDAASSRGDVSYALALVEVDGFRAINEQFGHLAGDRVLVATAHALVSETRGSDAVGRIGGQTFGILLRGLEPADMRSVAERITRACRELPVPGHPEIEVSVSVALVSGSVVPEADELLRTAQSLLVDGRPEGGARAIVAVEREHLLA